MFHRNNQDNLDRKRHRRHRKFINTAQTRDQDTDSPPTREKKNRKFPLTEEDKAIFAAIEKAALESDSDEEKRNIRIRVYRSLFEGSPSSVASTSDQESPASGLSNNT